MTSPDRAAARPLTEAARQTAMLAHLPAALVFMCLPVLLTSPLALDPAHQLPGAGPDDNVMFLWNFSWMREVLDRGLANPFHTSMMFAPDGADLVLHTHTALAAFIGATVFGALPVASALNSVLLLSCALNGFLAYLLAHKATGSRPASLLAGVFFAASPAMVNHLFGHFNFYAAWTLLLFVLALMAALDRRSTPHALAAGVALAAVAFNDYYYFVYAATFGLVLVAHLWFGASIVLRPSRPRIRVDVVLVVVAAIATAVALTIAVTGGLVINSPIRISLTTGINVRAVGAAAALWALWRRWPVALDVSRASIHRSELRSMAVVLVTAAVLMSPILIAAADLWRRGDYVSQVYFWRSSPTGVDPATLVTGNPFNAWWGSSVMRLFAATGIHAFDGPLWMGIVPVVLLLTYRRWRDAHGVRFWILVSAVFLVWALGPFLIVFGVNLGLPLPQFLLRFVPIASNARIPSHAVIFVYLAAAVLLAHAVAASGRRTPVRVAALLVVLVVDFWVAPFPMHRLEVPAVYTRLAALPDGVVLEVPLGMRDGFGEEGRQDPNGLFYQSVHGKPLSGGYIARLPRTVKDRLHASPLRNALLRLSAGLPLEGGVPSSANARDELHRDGVKYVVVNRQLANDELLGFLAQWPIRLIDASGPHELYEVEQPGRR
jgi:hypothetical protein